ncbi:hypothetical protein HFP89_10045 [Wenzhouxiangella sp. XN79A]|uniref:hypothetical protein n=1 Tax=Wenzhouxiangella sp. XN79A TaxID=2724193 RepID=UPI00144AB280|nr:hypothetical protein [Wenzhouxiangella sp. XN79A]NKI35507.1 hypothetical protein [Wenzhouxiangella sp. XN79A]
MAIVLLASATIAHGTALIWQERPLPTPDVQFLQVASSGTMLLARGFDIDEPFGPGLLFISDNGLDWTPIDPGLAGRSVDAIGFALDHFVVITEDGELLLGNDDAASWSTRPAAVDPSASIRGVVEHERRVWMLATWRFGPAAAELVSSADFIDWTTEYSSEAIGVLFDPILGNLTAGDGALALTKMSPPPAVTTGAALALSSDGPDWLSFSSNNPPAGPPVSPGGLAWNGSAFVGLAAPPLDGSPTPLQIVQRTPDGNSDVFEYPDRVGKFRTLHGGPDGLVVQQLDDDAHRLWTSRDGTDWFEESVVPSGTFRGFARWKGGWVGVGTTTIRGVPRQALPIPTLPLGGLTVLAIVLALAGSVAVARRRPTSPSGSSTPGG